MNIYGIRAIYHFEMARTFRTLWQSIVAPVLTTSLYFIVFGKAIGSRMGDIDNVSYGAFIIPGLVMLNLLNESISNASFGIYMPKWAGTIYELLSAPVRRCFPTKYERCVPFQSGKWRECHRCSFQCPLGLMHQTDEDVLQ